MSQRLLFGYPSLMRAGLGNMLIPWADCFIWCKDNKAKMIAPFWTKLRIGPIIRRERDKRLYHRLFDSSFQISGLKRFFLLCTCKKYLFDEFSSKLYLTDKPIIVFQDMNKFCRLVGRDEEVNQALISITKPKLLPEISTNPFVGIHVRLGDYPTVYNVSTAPLTSRLPIDWYVAALREVRKTLGSQIDATIFSDGTDSELAPLLTIPRVSRSSYKEAITDVIALSRSTVIIGSSSTFSMWGAYLRQTQAIWYPGRKPANVFRCSEASKKETEWNVGMTFEDSFSHELVHRYKTSLSERI